MRDYEGNQLVTDGGVYATPVAAAAAAANLVGAANPNTISPTKTSTGPSRLCRIVVTTIGTAALSFYDNATAAAGTILFTIPASAPVGSIYNVQMPAQNGSWVASGANSPAVTVSWS